MATHTDRRQAAQLAAGRVVLWTANWSMGRRVALFVFGLLMQFFHAIYLRMLLVPGYEWLGPVDPFIYLLTEALAVVTNFGLLALPFVKAPGGRMRAVLMTSLALGALASAARMIDGLLFRGAFTYYVTCAQGPCHEDILLRILVTDVWSYTMYGFALYLSLSFLWKIGRHERAAAVG